jgi:hypothetical protein
MLEWTPSIAAFSFQEDPYFDWHMRELRPERDRRFAELF